MTTLHELRDALATPPDGLHSPDLVAIRAGVRRRRRRRTGAAGLGAGLATVALVVTLTSIDGGPSSAGADVSTSPPPRTPSEPVTTSSWHSVSPWAGPTRISASDRIRALLPGTRIVTMTGGGPSMYVRASAPGGTTVLLTAERLPLHERPGDGCGLRIGVVTQTPCGQTTVPGQGRVDVVEGVPTPVSFGASTVTLAVETYREGGRFTVTITESTTKRGATVTRPGPYSIEQLAAVANDPRVYAPPPTTR